MLAEIELQLHTLHLPTAARGAIYHWSYSMIHIALFHMFLSFSL